MRAQSNMNAGPTSMDDRGGVPAPPAFVSAVPRDGRTGGKNPRFRTPVEIIAALPTSVPWVAKPWLARGCITELAGKVKLAGKTTFVCSMLASVLHEQEFLGEETSRTNVVWLSEQPEQSLKEALTRAGLGEETGMAIQFFHEVRGTDWPRIVEGAVEEAHRRGAGVLVVDTLGQFAGLRGESENSSGDALAAVEPLQMAAASGLAVIVTRHERKGGGDVGDSARGSSAFTGAVDIVMALRRPEGAHRPTIRVIHAVSRFDGTPAELFVDFDGATYRSLGSGHDVGHRDLRDRILRVLREESDEMLRIDALCALLPNSKRTAVQRALDSLLAEGLVERGGKGRKGDAFTYSLPGSSLHDRADSSCPDSGSHRGGRNGRPGDRLESECAGD